MIRGKRFEIFNTDLRIDKLAIPKFIDLPVPDNAGAQSTADMVSVIVQENEKNLERNSRIEQQLINYPYAYEIVPYEYDEKKLLAKGFQFVLMRINSSGLDVRKMLGYEISDDINELITIKKNRDHSTKSIHL